MFLDFNLLRDGLPKLEEEEKARVLAENSYIRVLGASELKDVSDISTESLADIMLNMHEYTKEICNASNRIGCLFSGVRQVKRVATARLL